MNKIKNLKLFKRKCPICSNKNYQFLYRKKNYLKINSEGQIFIIDHRLVICKKCNFIYTNPHLNYHDTNKIYSSSVIGNAFEKTNKSIIHFNTFNKILKKNNINKIKNVLEVGAATGSLLKNIVKKYKIKKNNAMGIEPSKALYKQLKNNPYFMVQNAFIEKMKTKKKFDFVVLDNVLEHLEKPNNSIKKIKEYINKNCIFYISVPNTLNIKLNFRDPFGHTCNYYEKNLRYLLNINNFQIIDIIKNKWITLVAKLGNKKNDKIDFNKDRKKILLNLKKKINSSNFFKRKIKKKIRNLSAKITKNSWSVLIYGAGNYSLEILTYLNFNKQITKLIDQNPIYHYKKRLGYFVIAPKDIINEKFDKIIIASGKFKKDITEQLNNIGISNNKIISI